MVPDYLFISDEMNVGWWREEVVVVGRVPELVVSQDQVPPRLGRGVGSAGVEQVTEHLYIIPLTSSSKYFPVEEENVSWLGLHEDGVLQTVADGREAVHVY